MNLEICILNLEFLKDKHRSKPNYVTCMSGAENVQILQLGVLHSDAAVMTMFQACTRLSSKDWPRTGSYSHFPLLT